MANTFPAIAVLVGTIIGAGILGIPYVIMQSGFLIGIIHLIVLAAILLLIHLYLGEVTLRTVKKHHLAGYAEKYLGKKGKLLMFLSLLFGIYSALIAYLIGEGESFSHLFFQTSEYSLIFGFLFWAVLSIISFLGLKALKEGEEIGLMFIVILIVSILVLFWGKIDIYNLNYSNPSLFYIPFGVILFAFLGFSAMPDVGRILDKNKKEMKRTIILSFIFVLIIYIIFALVVIGSQGADTPQLATLALGKPFILLGIITMFTSYLALSNALIDTFTFDYKFSKLKSWIFTIAPPFLIFLVLHLTQSASFVKVLGIGGVMSGGIASILILFMVRRSKLICDRIPEYSIPHSKYLAWIIIIILILGTILEIVHVL